jgi:phospholipase C
MAPRQAEGLARGGLVCSESVTGDLTSAFDFAASPNFSIPRLPRRPGPRRS